MRQRIFGVEGFSCANKCDAESRSGCRISMNYQNATAGAEGEGNLDAPAPSSHVHGRFSESDYGYAKQRNTCATPFKINRDCNSNPGGSLTLTGPYLKKESMLMFPVDRLQSNLPTKWTFGMNPGSSLSRAGGRRCCANLSSPDKRGVYRGTSLIKIIPPH